MDVTWKNKKIYESNLYEMDGQSIYFQLKSDANILLLTKLSLSSTEKRKIF